MKKLYIPIIVFNFVQKYVQINFLSHDNNNDFRFQKKYKEIS